MKTILLAMLILTSYESFAFEMTGIAYSPRVLEECNNPDSFIAELDAQTKADLQCVSHVAKRKSSFNFNRGCHVSGRVGYAYYYIGFIEATANFECF